MYLFAFVLFLFLPFPHFFSLLCVAPAAMLPYILFAVRVRVFLLLSMSSLYALDVFLSV